ncbi:MULTISPECIES: CitMHS family transporter [Streptomyces]|uniref:CitMHS family citrate-Mg2+:H+ or citrate-Ca2+:H+ symporter n=1 Tax=Streptomyces stelliscabiei TaxID=146820 RepID=A0A8I0P4M6_9ACTN|nr:MULTISPECIES: citrate:proton symporter [Streptomyces]KND43650.1 citrate:proton symporter [Streptomyces stelliscabiei]MBE1595950.1 CitMHS family citrate-Mg2+:H+ or citrate-Ca2+:H+ symporter [Streptomyces stelliscabiei]MDX2517517.1 citrate:proton symporter [Streptomyces stelliscabiei]MDX2555126.1 citrate:proton symporter [Streptomyces stelliscabiei]MDX2615479.1 citrate:proton symporter [Streptomyces stelliscabiei]
MLTILGFAMIATFLVLIMMKKMSPIAALVLIPALFCVFVGKGAHLGDYVIEGVGNLAPTAAMLMFAIVYFGLMIDVGLFDPIVRGILKFCKADPLRIVVGTALLAAIVSLDGDGSTTFMITVSAMYPLYKRLKMSLVVMTGVAATANGVMNTLPWGGPTARAATALKLDAADIFVPMIPALLVGLLFVFVLAYFLGLRERKRLGVLSLDEVLEQEKIVKDGAEDGETTGSEETVLVGAGAASAAGSHSGDDKLRTAKTTGGAGSGTDAEDDAEDDVRLQGLDPNRPTLRPKLYWFNALLTVTLLTAMIMEWLPIPVLFLLGAALALTVNFPHIPDQKDRLAAHADNVLNVSGMVFAAAVFTGVLQGTGMVDSMAKWIVDGIPGGMGPHMALVTGFLSLPLTYFMSNDGFYFGVLPVLAEAGAAHGVSPLEIARASLVGQPLHMSSPLVPAVYVLVGMAKVEFGDHTKFVVKWAAATSLIILGAGVLFGII